MNIHIGATIIPTIDPESALNELSKDIRAIEGIHLYGSRTSHLSSGEIDVYMTMDADIETDDLPNYIIRHIKVNLKSYRLKSMFPFVPKADLMPDTDTTKENTTVNNNENIIDKFSGTYGFLSNFFNVPMWGYKSVEHAFQAMKTRDPKKREQFKDVNMTPGQAKRKGRALELRDDWEQIKDDVMLSCLREKFDPELHPNLHKRLMATGDATLIEGNTWHDNYWGDCSCGKREECKAPGDNMLGKLLMKLRAEFKEDQPMVKEAKHIVINNEEEKTEVDYDELEAQIEARREVYDIVEVGDGALVEVYVVPSLGETDNTTLDKFFITQAEYEGMERAFSGAEDDLPEDAESFLETWVKDQAREHYNNLSITLQVDDLTNTNNTTSKEDTMPETPDTNPPSLAEKLVTNTEEKPMQESLFPLSTVLTDSGTEGVEFVVSFRPNAETEWDQEIVVPTLIRAMHYIAQQKIVSGEYKVDSVIGDTTINVNINHTKEDKVYEYKMAADWSSYMEVRVLTNVHDDGEQYAIKVYNDLLGTQQRLHWREPERPGKVWMDQEKTFERQLEMTADYLTERNGEPSNGIKVTPMFVSTNWRYAFLQERIIAVGGKFRIMSFGKKTITKMDADAEELPLTLDDLIASSSFSYAEGDNLVIMNVANHAGQHISWDEFADYVGVNINMFVNDKPSTKLGKRIKEVMRNTLYADYMTKPLDILGVEFDPSLEKAVDGIGGTSMSCFLRMVSNISDPTVRNQSWRDVKNGTITRYSLRYLMGEGLFKGDGIIVPDEVLKAMYPEYYAEHGKVPDMVQPMINGEFINLKKEFSTDGSWMMHTANPHHASNQPMTNDQLLAIFSTNPVEPWMFPAEQLKADHLAFVNEVFDELKAGKFPTYMRSDWMSSETGEIKMDPDRLALRMQQLSVRWTFHGRSLMESGHFIKLNAKGFHNRLEKWAMEGNKAKAKIVMPIGHAAYVHVTTLSIIHMLGYDPASEGYDTTKCFYYQQAHSWVKPDAVFIHDFERHGGEDGDDSEIVMIRKTYDEDKGETPETAVMRAVSVRMPCAWGEFSINEVDDSGFPYHNTWNDMPTVNITKGVRPEFVEEMKEQQVVQGLPYSEVETPESYTPAWVQFMTSLIVKNPGVGRIINPMIAYYTVAHSFFPEQLDNTEAFVDCLKQTPNEGAFIAIDLEIDRMLRMVAESGGVIDDHIYNTRIKGLELGKDSDTTIAAENTTFFSQMWHFTVGVAKAWKNQTNILARNRQEIPVKAAVKGLAERGITKPEMVTIIDQGEEKVVNLMAITEGLLQHFNERQSRFNLFPEGEARRHFSGNLCREITMWLDAQPVKSRNWILIQMYLNIWATKKKTDMFLFQTPLNAGDMSTMDYFLATLYQLGLAAKVDYTNYSRKYKLVVNNSAPVEEKTDNSESGEGATGIY